MTQAERSLINRSTDEEISAATTSREVHLGAGGSPCGARKRGRRTVGLRHIGPSKSSSSSRVSAVKQVPRTARTAGRLGGSNGEQWRRRRPVTGAATATAAPWHVPNRMKRPVGVHSCCLLRQGTRERAREREKEPGSLLKIKTCLTNVLDSPAEGHYLRPGELVAAIHIRIRVSR